MSSLFDVLDNTYQPTSVYSFEFRERHPLTGKVGKRLTELFFLLPPEEYSINEGYKITVNRTIDGGWVDDFGNDFKDIKISGSLYTYYVGTPAKTSLGASNLPPLVRNLKNQGLGIANKFKELANSFASQIGLDIPGLEIISGLDEFFKLRYILSRFRDTKTKENLTSDQAIVKKFPELQKLLSRAQSQKKLFKDIAVIYHDYDDNNHYEVTFNNFNMARSAKDPFTIMYKIHLTGLKEFNNQYSGIGFSKKKEDPFSVVNDIVNEINNINQELLEITNVPVILLNTITGFIDATTQIADTVQNIVKSFGINAINEIAKISQSGIDLITASKNFVTTVTENAFPDKVGESIDDVIEKYLNEEDDYLITSEDILRTISLGNQSLNIGTHLKGSSKYFTEYVSEINFEQNRVLNQNDFDIEIEGSEEKQENTLSFRDKSYYQVIQGDDLPSLANRFYGNFEQYTIIGEANDITNKDFENKGMVGKNITIPSLFDTSAKESNFNLVYFERVRIVTPKERQIQILGNDLDLNENRLIVVDGSGDLSLVYGEDCYFENMLDRVKFVIGSLNPSHPNWGIELETGEVPASITLSRIYDSIEQQISLDPRTEFVYINRETSKVEADVVRINLNYKPINGYEKTINIGDIVAGLLI